MEFPKSFWHFLGQRNNPQLIYIYIHCFQSSLGRNEEFPLCSLSCQCVGLQLWEGECPITSDVTCPTSNQKAIATAINGRAIWHLPSGGLGGGTWSGV